MGYTSVGQVSTGWASMSDCLAQGGEWADGACLLSAKDLGSACVLSGGRWTGTECVAPGTTTAPPSPGPTTVAQPSSSSGGVGVGVLLAAGALAFTAALLGRYLARRKR